MAEKLLIQNNVDILYGSYVIDVCLENGRIKSLLVQNKSGKTAYYASSVVDATGDCDIAHFAKIPTETFKQGNVLAAWHYLTRQNGYELQKLGAADVPDEERSKNEGTHLVNKRFSGLDGEEISEMVCLSHNKILENWLKERESDASCVISTIPTIPQLRMTRKIVGEYELAHTEMHTYFEDSIGMVSNWKRRGPVWEVPFRTLYNKSVKNLIVAGRCTSVNETLWDVMRVIPCCAVTGQAAGTAAAMTDDFSTLDVSKLQEKLKNNGVILHTQDIFKK